MKNLSVISLVYLFLIEHKKIYRPYGSCVEVKNSIAWGRYAVLRHRQWRHSLWFKKYCTSNFHSSPTYRLQMLCKFIGYCYLANFALWHYRLPVHSAGRSFDSCDLFLPLEQLLLCLQKLRCTYGTTDYRSCYMKKCLLSDTIILLCVFIYDFH